MRTLQALLRRIRSCRPLCRPLLGPLRMELTTGDVGRECVSLNAKNSVLLGTHTMSPRTKNGLPFLTVVAFNLLISFQHLSASLICISNFCISCYFITNLLAVTYLQSKDSISTFLCYTLLELRFIMPDVYLTFLNATGCLCKLLNKVCTTQLLNDICNLLAEALPEDGNDVSEMAQLQPLDLSFRFPGKCIFLLNLVESSGADGSCFVTYFLELTWFVCQVIRYISGIPVSF